MRNTLPPLRSNDLRWAAATRDPDIFVEIPAPSLGAALFVEGVAHTPHAARRKKAAWQCDPDIFLDT